ncbi:MlaA family lipoprotein [Pedosphaera parvula]|uniref:VacJ family lipoprotein n=1 Tax=Pedosphaera parvula (strain Ellin514) TaxID=320771 RepID=B9XJ39_PEDPL|nr:VacJ family lipoprotein [Pedosphaera parvula]EEF60077.1 VacJ family lipoprotein [Pedosphaera parvula Ellin514]
MIEIALGQPIAPPTTNALPQTVPPSLAGDSIVLPSGFNDPIEPFNRAIWGFNTGFMTSLVRPTSKVYRRVVAKPVRTGIGNMGKNLTYPGRLANNMLQGNWAGMGQETERCLCNTVLGLGGFFDVATHWGVPKNDADFGQTFRKWGWQPGCYLMLPVFGPSDGRDATGLVGDMAANPLTYFAPYSYIGSGVAANNFGDTVEGAVRFSQAEADSYSILQYAWSFGHENRRVDWRVDGSKDEAALETLQSIFFTYTNAEFPALGKTRSVLIPATGKKLDFTFWLQPGHAPVVYLVPGFGAHRLAGNELALAELLYQNGFSPVCISSTFHPEFMEHASSTDLPSYPPVGVRDVHVALTQIDRRLEELYPHRLGARALMGYSMGAFQTLFLAATAATNDTPLLKFDRYVAIDAPVRLQYCVTNVDQFYQAPLAWPAGERTSNIENTLLKVAALGARPPAPGSVLPFNDIESRFLIGLGFRLTLRDMIFSSQLRHNQGVLKHPLKKSRRRAAYEEIMQYSLWDYIDKFASPYDQARGIDIANPETMDKGTDLRTYSAELQDNHNIQVIANRNDFILAAEDLNWIEATFGPARATLFERGGHMGNLSQPVVQRAILEALDGLAEIQTASKTRHGLDSKSTHATSAENNK